MVMRMAYLVVEKERDEAGCLQELRSMKWLSGWVLHRVKRGEFCMNIWLIGMKSSTPGSWNRFAVTVWKKGLT